MAQPGREVGSRAVGHASAPEAFLAGKQGPNSWDMWWYRSPHHPGGEVQRHWTCGSVSAHLDWEVRSGAVRHVAA
jgi:hypothetical protein